MFSGDSDTCRCNEGKEPNTPYPKPVAIVRGISFETTECWDPNVKEQGACDAGDDVDRLCVHNRTFLFKLFIVLYIV